MFPWKTVVGGIADKIINVTNMFKGIKQNETINEVLFYGGDDEERKKQVGLNNLFCIYYIIAHAGRTIDISLPSLESDTITKCLVDVKVKNKAKIRVAVQESRDFCNLQNLVDSGIEVKVVKSKVKLEHEFILIDAGHSNLDAVAILGSLDYEINRVNCCRDATLLSSEATLVLALQREFDRVWNAEEETELFKQFDEIEEFK
ncbi:uncharacterized protein LOC123696309 [Colias croceus]|uniref:uncharacterized protein LOC123696309 n=1 Tax=Colias crocea TaxID=72248 RepID=UPI001E27CA6E|nr:uncharacterized protein LOC123696309 [Colias croceus]